MPPVGQEAGVGWREIVAWLGDPATHPERPQGVTRIETHISWVFLTDRYAYKLKKPVRYEFLDFSTPAARRLACQEELRLNRRLAADVYLGLVPITRDARGRLELGGSGEPLDWLVKMRRLPSARMLDRLIRTDRWTEPEIERLGERLAQFYLQASPELIVAADYRQSIAQHVRANLAELVRPQHGLDVPLVRRVHQAQLKSLVLDPALFDERVCDGRIVEGHGDLRPDHVCLLDEPVIFDCLEFSRPLRLVDVADELCFFWMECEHLGGQRVGQMVWNAYHEACGDQPPPRLLDFFRAYRACVRAKVAALRARQLRQSEAAAAQREAEEYLALADRYARPLGPPLVVVVSGRMGSGKTTLASGLSEQLGGRHLQTDAIRREILGASSAPADFGSGIYTPEAKARVYQELFQRAEEELRCGRDVILDGTFLESALCRRAAELALDHGALSLVVRCHSPRETTLARLASRAAQGESLSEARPDLYDAQAALEEPPPEGLPQLEVDTTDEVGLQLAAVVARLRQQVWDAGGDG